MSDVPTSPTGVGIKGEALRDGPLAGVVGRDWPMRVPVDREPLVCSVKPWICGHLTVAP